MNVPVLHRTFPGRVTRFADKIQMSTRTMDTEVDVPNPGLILVPGMYAEVNLQIEKRTNALAVPLDAVDGAGDAAQAWTVDSAGVIRIVPIKPRVSRRRRRWKSGRALHENDEVIVRPPRRVCTMEKRCPDPAFLKPARNNRSCPVSLLRLLI